MPDPFAEQHHEFIDLRTDLWVSAHERDAGAAACRGHDAGRELVE